MAGMNGALAQQPRGHPEDNIPDNLRSLPRMCPRDGCNSFDVQFRYFNNRIWKGFTVPRYKCRSCNKLFTLGGRLYNMGNAADAADPADAGGAAQPADAAGAAQPADAAGAAQPADAEDAPEPADPAIANDPADVAPEPADPAIANDPADVAPEPAVGVRVGAL